MGGGVSDLLHLEDFTVGHEDVYGPYRVTREEIIAFAREFDPQPFHLDDKAGDASMLGGLSASGWHSCAIGMRLIADGFLLRSASLGSPGIEETKWLKPVRPGDELSMRAKVLDNQPSRSRPEMGKVKFLFTLERAGGEAVMTQENWIMFKRRSVA